MNEDDKKQLQKFLIQLDTVIDTSTQNKKEELEMLKNEFSLMPFEKINDDIFDTDSEVLKSEKNHMSIRINGCENDIGKLNSIQIGLTNIKKILEEEEIIDRKTNLKPSV